MKIVVVVQARCGSSRLPNKVLMPLAGAPLLQRMLERVLAAKLPHEIVVATTHAVEDDAIESLATQMKLSCYRGHATDLLDRHYQAAKLHHADVVLKVPSDCPLIDPRCIDEVIETYLADPSAYDYVSNLHPPSYPDGNDVELMPFAILEQAWREAERAIDREHTTPFIWEHPTRFRLRNVAWSTGNDFSDSHRWTIDYAEDYELIRAVYDHLWSRTNPIFPLEAILALIEANPQIAALNANYLGWTWYRRQQAMQPDKALPQLANGAPL